MIGVLMSATLPARLGEPSRALILSRRVGRVRDRFPVVLGTLVSQTLLNLLALAILGAVMFATVGIFRGGEDALVFATIAPVVLIALLLAAPALLRRGKPSRFVRVQQALAAARGAMVQVRTRPRGLPQARASAPGPPPPSSPRGPSSGSSCYVLLVALGLDERAGIGAAAAVLFAVNVTAALPATPSNLGVFQAACVAVLSAYGVGHDRRARLRDHPPGGGDRHRAGDGHARAGARGHDLEGPAPARAARHAGGARRRAPPRQRRQGRDLTRVRPGLAPPRLAAVHLPAPSRRGRRGRTAWRASRWPRARRSRYANKAPRYAGGGPQGASACGIGRGSASGSAGRPRQPRAW